ncbi:transmembrane signal receptor [Lithospermum erythrorhizon]|uniref:Transmembrane signal receptor n=1 Tax=Lithospermum erythrorhizon TaxID=34254 RepID=A0AAV3RGT8_LITER
MAFQLSSIKSIAPFQLLHADVCGPYKTATYRGSHCFLTIVDDYTRAVWTFLMKYKSIVMQHIKGFFAMIENQFDAKVKTLKSDNGTEFINKESNEFFSSKGYKVYNLNTHKTQISRDVIFHETIFPFRYASLEMLDIELEPRPSTNVESQASKSQKWQQAMNKELKVLEKTGTWELKSLPKGKQPIGCKWVYKIKRNPDGTVERYKARLVAKGYTQVEEKDYNESFSPVAKAVTVRILFALATCSTWLPSASNGYK